MKVRIRVAGEDHALEAAWTEDGARVTIGDRTVLVAVHRLDEHAYLVREGGRRISCVAVAAGAQRHLWVDGRTLTYDIVDTRRAAMAAGGEAELVATLPGVVREVCVHVGDRVEAGQKLLVLESMKMEMAIHAPHAGHVEAVFCTVGQNVEAGEHLIAVQEDEA